MEAQGLLSVEAPAYLYITPREKDGKLLVHLFNLASENPLSPERPIVESVPQVGPVRVACPLAKEPVSYTHLKVEEANDTSMLPGSLVDIFRFERENLETLMAGKRPATAKRILLGITKACLLYTSSVPSV